MNFHTDTDASGRPFEGVNALVMGLGINGGGLESARFLARAGARVTVTDLRGEDVLAPSMAALAAFDIRYVLGRHEMDDFKAADLVIKNPAVRPDSPYLKAARRIETDISLFLAACPARILAVTGSKGKSSTSSALAHALRQLGRRVWLGGNISVSPLSFLDELDADCDVVLELSSWQLGDLRGKTKPDGRALLKPRVAIITTMLSDHMDRYGTMEKYVEDKKEIYRGQDNEDVTIVLDDEWGHVFAAETPARPLLYAPGATGSTLVPQEVLAVGSHQRQNLLAAGLALVDLGFDPAAIGPALASFPGIEHRLERFASFEGRLFYNDTAATVPEAAAAAVGAFKEPVVLVTGGTDKLLDFAPLAAAACAAKALVLLPGSGSDKLMPLLAAKGLSWQGPVDSAEAALAAAWKASAPGDVILLSPGCASFGLFLNEFDRGRKWKAAVETFIGAQSDGH